MCVGIHSNSKATLTKVVAKAVAAIRLNEHVEQDGATVFEHACCPGLEGIVKGFASSGRSPHRLKSKNPEPAAAIR